MKLCNLKIQPGTENSCSSFPASNFVQKPSKTPALGKKKFLCEVSENLPLNLRVLLNALNYITSSSYPWDFLTPNGPNLGLIPTAASKNYNWLLDYRNRRERQLARPWGTWRSRWRTCPQTAWNPVVFSLTRTYWLSCKFQISSNDVE